MKPCPFHELLREERAACWGDDASEEHILGVMLACHFGWNGVKVLKTAAEALEDANFHGECELVHRMITNIKRGFRQ
jgi:hypothetical protein